MGIYKKASEMTDEEYTAWITPEETQEVTAGTSVQDLKDTVDHVSEGHPVPVVFITDHFAELAQGINPATCKKCGAPMELHSQFEPTMQHYEEDNAPMSLSAHLAAEHDVLSGHSGAASSWVSNLRDLDPIEDGLILDRLQAIHSAKHAAVSDGNGGTLQAPNPDKPVFQVMPDALHNIKKDSCPTCKNPVFAFRDDLSKKEYGKSGMCQDCQDSVFGAPEGEDKHAYLHNELSRLEDAGNATAGNGGAEALQPIAIRYHNLADHIKNVTGTDPRPGAIQSEGSVKTSANTEGCNIGPQGDCQNPGHQYYLNGYTTSQEYGGPEEGGWWRDAYEPTGHSVSVHVHPSEVPSHFEDGHGPSTKWVPHESLDGLTPSKTKEPGGYFTGGDEDGYGAKWQQNTPEDDEKHEALETKLDTAAHSLEKHLNKTYTDDGPSGYSSPPSPADRDPMHEDTSDVGTSYREKGSGITVIPEPHPAVDDKHDPDYTHVTARESGCHQSPCSQGGGWDY